MSLVVNHNLMATNVANNLNTHYGKLAKSTQRLSTGLRVNSAADDAAGLAIRELQRADIAALQQGARNANDAISMIQTADAALGIIDEKLIRMKELAEQAATGTYDSTQRLMIDSEFQAMGAEIDRIAHATDFNGVHLLNYDDSNNYDYEVTLDASNTIIISSPDSYNEIVILNNNSITDSAHIEFGCFRRINFISGDRNILNCPGDSFSHEVSFRMKYDSGLHKCQFEDTYSNYHLIDLGNGFKVFDNDNTEIGNLTIDQPLSEDTYFEITFDGDHTNDGVPVDYNIAYPNAKLFKPSPLDDDFPEEYLGLGAVYYVDLHGNGNRDILLFAYDGGYIETRLSFDIKKEKKNNYEGIPDDIIKIHFGSGNDSAEDYYYINKSDATLNGLGLNGVSIETQDKAQKALNTINDAIVKKDNIRAYYGAMQNRLENTITNITTQAENLQAAESRISDVDVATEMTEFVRQQILAQSAVAMLSQANSMPQMAMQLIGG